MQFQPNLRKLWRNFEPVMTAQIGMRPSATTEGEVSRESAD